MMWFVTLWLAGASCTARCDDAVHAPSTVSVKPMDAADILAHEKRRIRTGNRRLMKLMQEGARRSRTFAGLVTRIHETNVIVYLEPTFALPPPMTGRILLQAAAGGQRYLRMQVRASLQGDQLISVIAHELRHAIEVAEDPSVVDPEALIGLYRRIGHESYGENGFDTEEAVAVGRIVRLELAS